MDVGTATTAASLTLTKETIQRLATAPAPTPAATPQGDTVILPPIVSDHGCKLDMLG